MKVRSKRGQSAWSVWREESEVVSACREGGTGGWGELGGGVAEVKVFV